MDNNSRHSKPLKICIISSFPPNKGGESTYAFSYAHAIEKYLVEKVSQVYIITFNETGNEKRKINKSGKISIHRVFNSFDLSKHFSFYSMLLLILKLKPDLVHCEYSPTPFHNFGGLLGEPLLFLFIILRKFFKIPVFVTLHTIWLPQEVTQRASELSKNSLVRFLITRYYSGFIKFFSKAVSKFYLLSNTESEKMISDFCSSYNISPSKVDIELHGIWKSVEIDRKISLGNHHENSENIINIRCLGFINPYKGYEYAIYAMKSIRNVLPKAVLTIAGDFTPNFAQHESKKYIEKLNEIIKSEELDPVVKIVQKYLSDDEFHQYIDTSDIILLPYSRVVAASGILHEAISKRIPVIVSGSGELFNALSEFIPVVSARDSDLLAEEIIKICTSSEYQDKIILYYQQYIDTHDWKRIVTKIYEDFILTRKK